MCVGTVTAAREGLRKYKHMSCLILVPLPLQWRKVGLDEFSQTSNCRRWIGQLETPRWSLQVLSTNMHVEVERRL